MALLKDVSMKSVEEEATTWRLNGKLHREDGPALLCANGSKHWWFHGIRHREDGPAVIRADGLKEWWYEGELIFKEVKDEE